MSRRFPQYSKTADPDALAAIGENERIRKEFHEAALAFAVKYAIDRPEPTVYGDNWMGVLHVGAIDSRTQPTAGRWTTSRQGWRPFKSNPVHREMVALTRSLKPVPGMPWVAEGPGDGQGRRHLLRSHPFAHDGVAYLGYSMAPAAHQRDGLWGEDLGEQWTEILASEYFVAHEAKYPKAAES